MLRRKKNPESSFPATRVERVVGKGATGFIAAIVIASLLMLAQWSQAVAAANNDGSNQKIPFDIPRQRADLALIEFAEQADVTFIFPFEEARREIANRLVGSYARDEAMRILLAGTGLEPAFDEHGALAVHITDTSTRKGSAMAMTSETNKRTLASVVAAILSVFSGERAIGQETQGMRSDTRIEEVVVTAQKRSERLRDVPVPVTAIGGQALLTGNLLRIQDFATNIPGFNFTPNVQSIKSLSIRGITTGGGSNPTVGVVVDDAPYGASTSSGGGNAVPDIDPGDLARVEVLRGPQGTLYGASSMGGLLKFVTVDPSTDELNGRLQVGTVTVHGGDGLGYNVRGSVNLPLSSAFAVRASAFSREDPGYIDNPLLGTDDVNTQRVRGGRVAGLWLPSEQVSLKLSAMYQKDEADGNAQVDALLPGVGDLQQRTVRDAGAYERTAQAYSAVLKVSLGAAELISVTGYNINEYDDSYDFSYGYGSTGQALYGVAGAPVLTQGESEKLSQELRLEVPLSGRVDWLIGAFYTDEDNWIANQIPAMEPLTGQVAGYLFNSLVDQTFSEYALFSNLTFRFTERFDLQVGGRQSRNEQMRQNTRIGVYAAGSPPPPAIVQPRLRTEEDAFTYLVTPRFKLTPDVMMYARFASGYRAGSPNNNPGGVAPAAYDPDKTYNYELGLKGDFFEQVLTLDASLFYIDWKGIQMQLNNPVDGTSYTTNGSDAASRGVELAAELRPATGLSVSSWISWTDASLVEDFPALSSAYGRDGDRLPQSSRVSGFFSIQQEFPLAVGLDAYVGGQVSYVGDRKGIFTGNALRADFPSYTKVDLRSGLRYDSWSADLYVNNVTDKRGVLTGGLGASPPFAFTYIQPRTIGVNLSKQF